MIGGWQLLRNHLEKVMFGSQKDGFQTEEEYSSAMIAGITSEHSNYQLFSLFAYYFFLKSILFRE